MLLIRSLGILKWRNLEALLYRGVDVKHVSSSERLESSDSTSVQEPLMITCVGYLQYSKF